MNIKLSLKHIIVIIFFGLTAGIVLGLVKKAHGKTTPIAQINKMVFNPATDTYVDNMTESDHRFSPQDIVTFSIVVSNIGKTTLSSISVVDIFPFSVTFLSGIGRFEDGKLTIDIGSLDPGESQEFIIRGQIPKEEQLPTDKAVICTENRVEMRGTTEGEDDVEVSDDSQLCIEHKVLGAKTPPKEKLPATGATKFFLITFSLAGVGLLLRKFA